MGDSLGYEVFTFFSGGRDFLLDAMGMVGRRLWLVVG